MATLTSRVRLLHWSTLPTVIICVLRVCFRNETDKVSGFPIWLGLTLETQLSDDGEQLIDTLRDESHVDLSEE
ncbi:hypothetical protein ACTXT7_005682 [Hymenolepis weldensis]